MGEFEDKLNSILSSPAELEKIMNVARSISGSMGSGTAEASSTETSGIDSISSALGGIDPKMLKLMTRLLGEYSTGAGDKAQILHAIKPYLKNERQEKIDRAVEIAKLAKLAKIAFSEFSGGDLNV